LFGFHSKPYQVLANDGYVGIINCNPAFQPLMQEAALHCANANVFWHWDRWQRGLLDGKLANAAKQPFRCSADLRVHVCVYVCAAPRMKLCEMQCLTSSAIGLTLCLLSML
jgi:hypothetical protein